MSWWGRLLAGLPVTAPERDSIWSVPRPFVRLYLVLFAIQAGWLISLAVRDVLATHGSQGVEIVAYETLRGLSQPGVGAAITSLLIVEVLSYLMVMYNFLMYHLVRPIILRHERRGEARGIEKGIAQGEAQATQRWQEWVRRSEAQGVQFPEPPPITEPEE
jgi:hypothetical protein